VLTTIRFWTRGPSASAFASAVTVTTCCRGWAAARLPAIPKLRMRLLNEFDNVCWVSFIGVAFFISLVSVETDRRRFQPGHLLLDGYLARAIAKYNVIQPLVAAESNRFPGRQHRDRIEA